MRRGLFAAWRDDPPESPRAGIELVEHRTLRVDEQTALVSDQERQSSGGVLQGVRSGTACSARAPGVPSGVPWSRLHETLLPPD